MVEGIIPDLVDSHCHLYFNLYDQDRDIVIERARQNGISRILIPGLDIETSRLAIEITHKYPETFAAVGIHPNDCSTWDNNTGKLLIELASDPKVVAIGEIGLDYYRNQSTMIDQQFIFREQLEIARELNLPVVIHNRDASDDLFRILFDWHTNLKRSGLELSRRPGVLHSFSGDLDFANRVIAMNFKIGISGPVTFTKKTDTLQSLVSELALDNVLLETDSPFLTPHPFRGKRNEPANVRIVGEKIAQLKGISLDQIAKITTDSANKLFRWSETP